MIHLVFFRSAICCAALAVFLVSGPCFAQAPEIDDPVRVDAKRLMHEAAAARKAGDREQARELYQESMKLYPSYDVACNLGGLSAEMGYLVDAATSLEFCLRNFPSGQSSKVKKRAKDTFDQVRTKVGTVRVEVTEPNVEVQIDGELVGTSPIEHDLFVLAGVHYAEVESEKGDADSTFRVEKGESVRVHLELAHKEEGAPMVEPKSQREEVPVEASEQVEKNWAPAWILGGATVVVLGTSFVFRGLASGKKEDIDDLRPAESDGCLDSVSASCREAQDAVDTHKTYATVSHASLIGGSVLAAATIGYLGYILMKKEPSVQAGVSIDRNSGIFTLSRSF